MGSILEDSELQFNFPTVTVLESSKAKYVNQWIHARPHFWFVVYADPMTCLTDPPTIDEVIEYEIEFLNPDSYGVANDHFGDDMKGEFLCVCVFVCV